MNDTNAPCPAEAPGDKISYGAVTARSSAALTAAKMIRYGLLFLVQAFLMNLLAPNEFGLIKYVTIILGLVNLITVAGINTAVIQKKTLEAHEYGPLFTLNALLCTALTALTCAAAPLIARIFGEPQLTALTQAGSSVVLIGGISTIHRSLLQREFRYGTIALIEAASAVISSAVAIILAFQGHGAWALCWSLVAFHASSSVMCIAAKRGVGISLTGTAAALPLFWFGTGWTLLKLLDYLSTNLGNLLIGRLFGTHTLGTFTIAYEMISMPQIGIGLVLVPVALSALSRMQGDNKRMKEAWLKLTFFTSSCVTAFCVIAGLCAHDLIKTITVLRPNAAWDNTAVFIQYLAPVIIAYSWGICTGLIWAANRKILTGLIWTAAMLTTMLAAILLGAPHGPLGVCTALFIRAALLFPVLVYVMKKTSGIPPGEYLKALAPSVVCGLITAAACAVIMWALTNLVHAHHTVRLISCAALSSAVFLSVMILFWRKDLKILLRYFARTKD